MTVVSPDGAKEARVYSNRRSGVIAVDTNTEETIELSERGQQSTMAPTVADTVARDDMQRGAVVALLWQDARHLLVMTSANLRSNGALRSVGGIRLTALSFDPRSPIEAACVDAFNRVASAPV